MLSEDQCEILFDLIDEEIKRFKYKRNLTDIEINAAIKFLENTKQAIINAEKEFELYESLCRKYQVFKQEYPI